MPDFHSGHGLNNSGSGIIPADIQRLMQAKARPLADHFGVMITVVLMAGRKCMNDTMNGIDIAPLVTAQYTCSGSKTVNWAFKDHKTAIMTDLASQGKIMNVFCPMPGQN
ncbi:hypothetical protein [Photobacterium sp. TY1-4]|uniref:hypothetical protein n=1 Tax=Photobacterium sp. TY1-4 TaxID=2899122 RepID=UPI0021BF6CD5|nr:hypothetical protein [Photobacterium sp. TY1-4]UXI04097.1 hypothetical protein NH461_18480 [Photobacterium sp. TY1-4]